MYTYVKYNQMAGYVEERQRQGPAPDAIDVLFCFSGTIGGEALVRTVQGEVVLMGNYRPGLGTNALLNAAGGVTVWLEATEDVTITQLKPTLTTGLSHQAKVRNPAEELRSLTSLPVRELSRLMRVSERSYNHWLATSPVAVTEALHPENERRLLRLFVLFQTLSEEGEDLRTWLLSPPAPTAKCRLDLIADAQDESSLVEAIRVLEHQRQLNLAVNLANLHDDILPGARGLDARERAALEAARRQNIIRVREPAPKPK
ncbi:MAG: hypothetical protein ACYDAG_13555 [Chloroflexota bacterium]